MKRTTYLLLSTALSAALLCGPAVAADTLPPPAQNTDRAAAAAASQADHARTMAMLHIAKLRPTLGANPEKPDNVVNFDEAKAGPFSKLPDPLTFDNGAKVTTPAMWAKRRVEIMAAYDREVLGRTPQHLPSVHWKVLSTTTGESGGVPFVRKELTGHVDNSAYPGISVEIELTLIVPAHAKHKVPVILAYSMSRSDAAMRAQMASVMSPDNAAEPIGGRMPKGFNWQQDALNKGWGYALYAPSSVQPDNGAGLTTGIIGLVNKGQPRSKPDEWGALKAWSWGASRAIDYLEKDPAIDGKHIAISGASRYGKGALVAMAYESRIATGYIASSGEGGAKLYRHNFGEMIENVASYEEYHWMAPNFLKYAGPLTANDLPVDANELIALCAPRPIFIGAGRTRNEGQWTPIGSDGWADAKGEFLAAADAGRVYKLLGKKPLPVTEFPPIETTLIDSDIGFRQHAQGHMMGPNWPTFMDFAAHYFPVDKQ